MQQHKRHLIANFPTTETKSLNCVTRAFTTASQAVEGLGMGRDLDSALNATSCECGLRLPEGGLC